jgi:predicted lipoprotein with Yx(FWY)xxD motif
MTPTAYEVEADYLEVRDPDGHKHWLTVGNPLPEWVTPEQAAALVESGAVTRYEEI